MHFKDDTIGKEIIDSRSLTLENLKNIRKVLAKYEYVFGNCYEQICYDLKMHFVDDGILPTYKVSDLTYMSPIIDWLNLYPLVTENGTKIYSPYELFYKSIREYQKLDKYKEIIDYASGYLPNLSKKLGNVFYGNIYAVDPSLDEEDPYFNGLPINFTAYKNLPNDKKFNNKTLLISRHPCNVEKDFIELAINTKSSMSLELCNCEACQQAEQLSKSFKDASLYEFFYSNHLSKQKEEIAKRFIETGIYNVETTDITEDAIYTEYPVIHAEVRPYKKLFITPRKK